MPSHPNRVIVIVLDSVGAGELPDAAQYGDTGSDTLGNLAAAVPLRIPALRRLGLGRVARLGGDPAPSMPEAAFGRMARSRPGRTRSRGTGS